MKYTVKIGAAAFALLLAAGCSRSGPTMSSGPSSLTPAPTGRVAANRLPPPPAPAAPGSSQETDNAQSDAERDAADQAGSESTDGQGTQVASLGAGGGGGSSSGGPLTRNSVLGAYKVTTTGGNCQIILSLTKWTGGYRAASRGCPGAVADVSAWDVSGNQVVLKDNGGSNVASLSSAGGSRYEGQTSGGQQISLYR